MPGAVMENLCQLATQALEKCRREGWARDWSNGGAYLHLESSEFIEALRGKRGLPEDEAADVLFVLLSMLEAHAIPIDTVIGKLQALCAPPKGGEP